RSEERVREVEEEPPARPPEPLVLPEVHREELVPQDLRRRRLPRAQEQREVVAVEEAAERAPVEEQGGEREHAEREHAIQGRPSGRGGSRALHRVAYRRGFHARRARERCATRSPTATRSCCIESRSRTVTVSAESVSPSIVMHQGVP